MLVSKNQKGKAVNFGGDWDSLRSNSGSRASVWFNLPSDSGGIVSARGVCDHLNASILNINLEDLDVCNKRSKK